MSTSEAHSPRCSRAGRVARPATIGDLLAARAASDPDRLAVIDGDETLTFGRWWERSTTLSRGLVARGLRSGDRVGLIFTGREWVDFVVAYCAVVIAGGAAVPLSANRTDDELRGSLAHCGATVVLHGDGAPPTEDDRSATIDAVTADAVGTGPPDRFVRPEDLAQIIYTSGTSGAPKGVSATHANLTHGWTPRPRHRPYAHSQHFLHAFPIGSNAAQIMLVTTLVARPTAVVLPRFTPGRFVRLIERYAVGTVFLVPTMAVEVLAARVHERHDTSSVLLLSSSAAPLPPAVATALPEAFPNAMIVNFYTSTEAMPAQTTVIVDPERPASLGRPTSGSNLKIVTADGRAAATGEVGEVRLRSPAAGRGYYGDPRATADVFIDGWVRMGDLGYLDDDGYLYLVDRESDVIKSGGLKVSTLAVEAVLHEHPAVAEAAVVGVPHPALGKAAAAAVRPHTPTTVGELRAFLTRRLARHEVPARLLIVDALPKNETGKVIKRRVAELFTDTKEAT